MGKNSTSQKETVLAALLAGEPSESAAARAGVSVRTVYRWLQEPEFFAALESGRAAMRQKVLNRLAGQGERAVVILANIMESGGREDNTRRLAAVNILELLERYYNLVNIEKRLVALEEQILTGK